MADVTLFDDPYGSDPAVRPPGPDGAPTWSVAELSVHLGRMLASLERRGLLRDTLVIVTSDHAMPSPRVKGNTYPFAVHVPLAMMWPEGIAHPGRTVDDFVSFIDMDAACTGDPCAVAATGAAPGDGKEASTFVWQDGGFVTTVSYQDTCVANDGSGLLAQHGYDDEVRTVLTPVIVVDGEVLAWTGTYSATNTPTADAAAKWPEDCFAGHESEAIAVATTQPYFQGL